MLHLHRVSINAWPGTQLLPVSGLQLLPYRKFNNPPLTDPPQLYVLPDDPGSKLIVEPSRMEGNQKAA